MVFTPGQSYGYYLDPTASISGATITLPETVLIDKLWNRFTESFNVRMYAVGDGEYDITNDTLGG
jgi:hypothetical protein